MLSNRILACTAEHRPTSWPSHLPSRCLARDPAAAIGLDAFAGVAGLDCSAADIPLYLCVDLKSCLVACELRYWILVSVSSGLCYLSSVALRCVVLLLGLFLAIESCLLSFSGLKLRRDFRFIVVLVVTNNRLLSRRAR